MPNETASEAPCHSRFLRLRRRNDKDFRIGSEVFLSFIVLVIPTPQAEESCSHGSWAHTISTSLDKVPRARADKYLGAGGNERSPASPRIRLWPVSLTQAG